MNIDLESFDVQSQIKELCRTVDSLASDAKDPSTLLQQLGKFYHCQNGDEDTPVILPAIERGLGHTFEPDANNPGAVILGERLASLTPGWPPPLAETDEVERHLWLAIASELTHPLPKAHFLDLTLSTHTKSDRATGAEVARLYIELGQDPTLDPYYRGECLRRSWSICRQYSMKLEKNTRAALFQYASSPPLNDPSFAGFLMQALEPLSIPPRTGDFSSPTKDEVRGLLFSIRPDKAPSFLLDMVTDLLVKTSDSQEEKNQAHKEHANILLSSAKASTGLNRTHLLITAAEYTKRFQLNELHRLTIVGLQKNPPDDSDFTLIKTEQRAPIYTFDFRLRYYRRASDTGNALDVWFSTPSPTGDHTENQSHAQENARNRFVSNFTRIEFDEHGMPKVTASGPQNAEEFWLKQKEQINYQSTGLILSRELKEICTEFGFWSPEEISTHMSTVYSCDETLSLRLGDAITHFWKADYPNAARIALPLVEAGARSLLQALDDPLYRIATGNTEGRFPALDTYISKLASHDFDANWIRFLKNPISPLRNSIAHGHKLDPSEIDAVLLIRAAGLLILLTPAGLASGNTNTVHSRLRDPVSWVGSRANLVRKRRFVWEPESHRPILSDGLLARIKLVVSKFGRSH